MFAATARPIVAAASLSWGASGRCSEGSIPGLRSGRLKERLQMVEHAVGDPLLGGALQPQRLPPGGEDRHRVVGGVEADPGLRDVVYDDRVQALAVQLAP